MGRSEPDWHSQRPLQFELRGRTFTFARSTMNKENFEYAIENTQVILAPEQQIPTFGSASFNFYLISELMDRVDSVRVRNGKIHAERPDLQPPERPPPISPEGSGEKAQQYVEQLRE